MRISRFALGGLVVAAVACSGCYSKATAYDGKFTFAYASGLTQVENFIKPIAPGAKLDVVAYANSNDEDQLTIVRAVSSKTSVLVVERVRGTTLTLKGVSPGVAEVEVTVRDPQGHELADKMFFHVAKPTVHKLEHSCTEDRDAIYVRGENVDVWHSLSTADKRFVLGYDYTPLTINPPRALDLVTAPQAGGLYRFTSKNKGAINVKSSIDGSAIGVHVIERGELTKAILHKNDKIVERRTGYAIAEVLAEDKDGRTLALCNQNARTRARSLTPDICKVSAKLDDEPDSFADDENRSQMITITGIKFGECSYEVILPDLNGGRGLTLAGSAKVGRIEFPGDGGHAGFITPQQRVFESMTTMATIYALVRALLLGVVLFAQRRSLRRIDDRACVRDD